MHAGKANKSERGILEIAQNKEPYMAYALTLLAFLDWYRARMGEGGEAPVGVRGGSEGGCWGWGWTLSSSSCTSGHLRQSGRLNRKLTSLMPPSLSTAMRTHGKELPEASAARNIVSLACRKLSGLLESNGNAATSIAERASACPSSLEIISLPCSRMIRVFSRPARVDTQLLQRVIL